MGAPYDLVFQGGTAVLPGRTVQADVAVRDGQIVAVGDLDPAAMPGDPQARIDCSGLHVLPGLIDSQVHFREPGLEHKEDLESGTRAAVLGGITAIFEMPNTNPNTDTPAALTDKLTRAKGRSWCEHAFFLGATPDNAERIGDWERSEGCSGIKVFMGSSTGNLLVEKDGDVERVLRSGMRRIAVHCEDEERLRARKSVAEEAGHPRAHPEWRDEQTAFLATQRLLDLARKTGRRVHVLHVTTAEEMELLAQYKDIATVEVTPQHLSLFAPDCYDRIGSLAQMNPPVRAERHQMGLWAALAAGIVDVIGSDHAPHTREEKAKPYPASPAGMPGVQTTVPLMLDHVNAGRLSLERLVDLMAYGPQRLFDIAAKGRLVVGYDADLTVVDLAAQWTIQDQDMAYKCGWTPFNGRSVTGKPVMTVIRGHMVMRDGAVQGSPIGKPVRFLPQVPAA